MNTITLFLLISLVVLVSSAPRGFEPGHPKYLPRRSAHKQPQYVKGQALGVKGGHVSTPNPSLRKGEYICGDRVCKLRPGEIPKGCNGMCQHRVK